MVPQNDATNLIYVAGMMVTLVGLMELAKGETTLAVASLILGPALVIQRILRNRKRPKA